ncbi:DUF4185 domain-containing protein [Streptomyces uncialis]|uniref:DUF4185 domain-containing protein n=1 Tax=Streptomyces uncialis TaxID=1048205 RepID=UPI003863A00B
MAADLPPRRTFPSRRVLLPRRPRLAGALALALALLTALAVATLPGGDTSPDRTGRTCTPRTVASWEPDPAVTGEFARYGDDGILHDDWTGGDGTHSVRLPDGRVLWLFSDTFLGRVHQPPNPSGQPHTWREMSAPAVRNSGVLMSASGVLERTLPAPLFPDPAPDRWRWPVAARVEPRTPGSDERVVRVLLWTRETGRAPWIYGVPAATEVATLSLPDLRVEGITTVLDQSSVADPAERVLFGTAAVADGGWTYVFGGDDGRSALGRHAYAYVARVPDGRLAESGAWRYWDGRGWSRRAEPRPVLGDGDAKGVGSAFTVVRDGDTYTLFTMAAGTRGLTTVTAYWACSPSGPWQGPVKEFAPPLPEDSGGGGGLAAYNPRTHPALGTDGGLLLSYDVNWLDAAPGVAHTEVNRNVSLYRPRFLRLRLTPGD